MFSTSNLKNAYHQLSLKESDKKYTGFEADGHLRQFRRVFCLSSAKRGICQKPTIKSTVENHLQQPMFVTGPSELPRYVKEMNKKAISLINVGYLMME